MFIAWARGSAPVGEVARGHLRGVIGRPRGVAPGGGAAGGQHADAGAPGAEQAHALVARHKVVAEVSANQAQLSRVARLACAQQRRVSEPAASGRDRRIRQELDVWTPVGREANQLQKLHWLLV